MVNLITPPVSIAATETATSGGSSNSSSNEDGNEEESDDEQQQQQQQQQVILIQDNNASTNRQCNSSSAASRQRIADRAAAAAALLAAADAHAAGRAAAAATSASSLLGKNSSNKRARRHTTRQEEEEDRRGGCALLLKRNGHDSSDDMDDNNAEDDAEDDDSMDDLDYKEDECNNSNHEGSDIPMRAASAPAAAAAAAGVAAPGGNAGTLDDPIDLLANNVGGRNTRTTTFAFQEFMEMWNTVNDDIGMDTEVIEDTARFREANRALTQQESAEQESAQYGRLLYPATQRILTQVLKIRKNSRHDVFVDFGSGLANTVLQAAFTRGVESKGIEIADHRHAVSCVYKIKLLELATKKAADDDDYQDKKPGKITLQKGRIESKASRDYLINPGRVTKAICNNFNGVFGFRSARPGVKDGYNIDDYVSGLFFLMQEGSILVTFYPLKLGPSRQEVNALRRKAGLAESPNAACYDMEDIVLGQARHVVSWSEGGGNEKLIHLYKYTRVVQTGKPTPDANNKDNNDDSNIHNRAVLMCSSPSCRHFKEGTLYPATKFYEHTPPGRTRPVQRVVINACECGYVAKISRTRAKINYNLNASSSM
jgi:Histone methylation protein DOT1